MAIIGLWGCSPAKESQEDESAEGNALLGVVQAVDETALTLTVAHEDIPGVMPAMTMVLRVGPGDVKVIKVGDQISARLVRDEDGGFRLIKIWKVDDKAAREMRIINKRLAAKVEEMERGRYLAEGDQLPDFALLDQNGATVTPERLKGKAFVMNFIFTRCTDAKMCPLSTSKMAQLQDLARENGLENLEFVSVTLDPKYDTPGVLREYADRYAIEGDNFHFVTGPRQAVDQLIQSMALTHIETDDETKLVHSLVTLLANADREIVLRSTTSAWDPQAFLQAAAKLEGKTIAQK